MDDNLSEDDFGDALAFIRRCETAGDLDEFREQLLAIVEYVPGHIVSYTEFDLVARRAESVIRPPTYSFEGDTEILMKYVHQHPAFSEGLRTGDFAPRALSDVYTAEEFHATELYQQFYRRRESEDQIALMLPSGPELVLGVAVSRKTRGFTKREHAFLRMIAPHVGAAYLAARARTTAAAALAGEIADGPLDLIVLADGDRCRASAGAVAERLKIYLGEAPEEGGPMPDSLQKWIEAYRREPPTGQGGAPAQREIATADRGRLLGRLVKGTVPGIEHILVLEEHRKLTSLPHAVAAGLSPREADVAELLARGASTEAIATALTVSPHTVKRHLERIYEKLDAGSRGEAIAALLRGA